MKIRDRILIYFSTTVIGLTAVSLLIIYLLFSAHREEEFQQHQNNKISYTVKMLAEYKEMSEELAYLMDEQSLHDFYDEKMLIYDSKKNLIFSSLDSLEVIYARQIINQLSPANRWIETSEGHYDLIGVYLEHNLNSFYAISKAYDLQGHSKKMFLRNVLIAMFFLISVTVVFVSLYLSNKITRPLIRLAGDLNRYDLSKENPSFLTTDTTTREFKVLTDRFNALLKRTGDAFTFQKNALRHISHELKTPVAVLVSELERLALSSDPGQLQAGVGEQAKRAKSLGGIIQVLLEISKIDSGQQLTLQLSRIDEVLFDLIGELKIIHPDIDFSVGYFPENIREEKLLVEVNELLIRHAFLNLLTNAAMYTNDGQVFIEIDGNPRDHLTIRFKNTGPAINPEEKQFLFKQYFRGNTSRYTQGFGLGLVLTHKIIRHHKGSIRYEHQEGKYNVFETSVPYQVNKKSVTLPGLA